MGIKLNQINITGIRGAMEVLHLPLNGRSIALYGDNGTGKSSISDSLEWFFTDKVSHLASTEIDTKDALRNAKLNEDDDSAVSIEFTNIKLNATRKLFSKNKKLVSSISNNEDDFKNYISATEGKENIILRHQFLRDFVDKTKGDKLKSLSDIIGFSEVQKKKEILQKSFNWTKQEIKKQNFEGQINTQKQGLIKYLGASISQEKNLLEKINEVIKPLELGIEIKAMSDIEKVLDKLKNEGNKKLNEELAFLNRVNEVFTTLHSEISLFDKNYKMYKQEFNKISKDVKAIRQTFLSELLKLGDAVISKKYHVDASCPLCLSEKSLIELRAEIADRLKEIEESVKKKVIFDTAKETLKGLAQERLKRIDTILAEPLMKIDVHENLNLALNVLKIKISEFEKASLIKVTSGDDLPEDITIAIKPVDFAIQEKINSRITAIQEIFKKDNSAVWFSNISASKDAFLKIKGFEKQKAHFEKQKSSLEIIYDAFVKKQKEGLENFITTFSDKINGFYQYMNPDEPFQEIKIVTLGEDDELNGITVKYMYNGDWVSPPQKYFSESHLNCFGLSFFLASVEAFNENNKFIVLDDVISSFDTTHRKRFAELLFEKFSKYQIILLTHEAEWFNNFVTPLAKGKNWIINEIKWSEDRGTHLDDAPADLKARIEFGLASSKIDDLGNPIRRYLEIFLKELALNLEAKLKFQFNSDNEHRMPHELLMAIRSEIKKCSKDFTAHFPMMDRLQNSPLLNTLSHGGPFNPKIADLKAFWADITEMETLFVCQTDGCKKPKVSLRYHDNVAHLIRCGGNHLTYNWKKS